MVFTIDFCRQYNWEIVGDQLIIMSDREIMAQDVVDQFVTEIRPSIDSKKPVVRNSHLLPYVTIQPLRMSCPMCNAGLKPDKQWMACPNRHGILVTGKQLFALRKDSNQSLLKNSKSTTDIHTNRKLICPHCHSNMKSVNYQNSHVYIDICTKCQYRWLDFEEVDDIAGVEQAMLVAKTPH